ncbi:MAG: hypothetical protein AB7U43_00615 [Desulfobacter sp.]
MKLPIIEGKEVVPVRFIPFVTHGIYGRKIIVGILAHQLKPNCFPLDTYYSQSTAEIEAVIAEMQVVRHPRNKNNGTASVTHPSPLVEIFCVDSEEEPFVEDISPEEQEREELFYAHRLNVEGKPESIPTEKWRTVLWDMEPIIESAHREEDEIGIRGAKRKDWHVNTLKLIPANSFLWKEDFERIWQAHLDSYSVHDDDMLVTIDYGVDIENEEPSKPLVQEAFDRLNAVSKKQPVESKRHKITDEERKSKGKSAIQLAVEAFLDATPGGSKEGFYTFLKNQVKLPNEAILKDGESYAYFIKDVKERGAGQGVYLNHPKEGKKEGDPAWNHYSGNDVSGIISKEKKNRKTPLSENSP